MSRYDGLIIPRSYSEYLNKTDSATLSQMLQHLTGLWSHAVAAGDNKPVTSDAVKTELNANYYNKQSVNDLINKVKINFIEVEGVTGSTGELSIPLSASHFILACYTNIDDTYADVSHYEGTLYFILKSYDGTIRSNAQVKATVAYL